MNRDKKENVQYGTAMFTLLSGIIMCFLSFFLHNHNIETSVLMYFGQTLIFCGAVFGINMYIKTQMMEVESRIEKKIQNNISQSQSNDE